jgi:Coenzyme PQQ synthesis protein D (PqqD)
MTDAGRLPSRVRFSSTVRVRVGPERGFLFDERSGAVYSLNASAALAADRMRSDAALDTIVEAVVEEFDVDPTTARSDLAKFVAALIAEGLASATREPRERPGASEA